jgi:hypothetical protein
VPEQLDLLASFIEQHERESPVRAASPTAARP